jgi:hypothetical protein
MARDARRETARGASPGTFCILMCDFDSCGLVFDFESGAAVKQGQGAVMA